MSDVTMSEITRMVDSQLLPAPAVWSIDPGHSCLGFECRHMMLTRMRGWFSSFSGEINVADDPTQSSVAVTIDANSLTMANATAAEAIRGDNFLAASKFPTLEFTSTRVSHVEAHLWHVVGDLTIKDTTIEMMLHATYEGVVPSLEQFGGRAKMAFRATGEFDRRKFGLDWNVPLPGGGLLVGNRVGLILDVEANLT